MKAHISALISGSIFGLGLTLSQMVNPKKVLDFLDIFGHWDPSLLFVMAGALSTTFIGYRIVFRNQRPSFTQKFRLPTRTDIDARLVIGAVIFGVGWGLSGLCPGPAFASASIAGPNIFIFLAMMVLGMASFKAVHRLIASKAQ